MGFRPLARAALRLVSEELRRLRARPAHRSTPQTLLALAAHHLHFDLDPRQPAPLLLPAEIGLRVGAALGRLDPRSREAALERASQIALRRCGLGSRQELGRTAQGVWLQLAPLWATLPMERWTAVERHSLVQLTRAKAGQSEVGYARLVAGNERLTAALARWSVGRHQPGE
jgi:hypothetical protein